MFLLIFIMAGENNSDISLTGNTLIIILVNAYKFPRPLECISDAISDDL